MTRVAIIDAGVGNLGNLKITRGDLDGAEAMYRKALEINERLSRLKGMAGDYGNLGSVMLTRSDLDGAEEMYRKALELWQRLGVPDRGARVRDLLGSLRD